VHPTDGWHLDSVEPDQAQHRSQADRLDAARRYVEKHPLPAGTGWTMLVDTMADAVVRTYAAEPEKILVFDEDGVLQYTSGVAPADYSPHKLVAWLEKRFPEAAAAPTAADK